MKRILSLLLALLMLAAFPAMAEETPDEGLTYEVAFEGIEVQFPWSDWMIWVPATLSYEVSDYESRILVSDGYAIWVEAMLEERSFDDVYAGYSRGLNFKESFITYTTINNFPVMAYQDTILFFDLGDGQLARFEIGLVRPFLKDYEAAREMVYQMVSSLHLPEEE